VDGYGFFDILGSASRRVGRAVVLVVAVGLLLNADWATRVIDGYLRYAVRTTEQRMHPYVDHITRDLRTPKPVPTVRPSEQAGSEVEHRAP
jgi:hypothetical protein